MTWEEKVNTIERVMDTFPIGDGTLGLDDVMVCIMDEDGVECAVVRLDEILARYTIDFDDFNDFLGCCDVVTAARNDAIEEIESKP